MPEENAEPDAASLPPLRANALTFTVDEIGLRYVRRMVAVMQKRYRMSLEQAVQELNSRLGAWGQCAVIVWGHEQSDWWFHETPEHSVRAMYEGMYWYRDNRARQKVAEWEAGHDEGTPVHEYLNWTAEQYAKWREDGTLPPPSTASPWEL
jgi:hypothetical protein